MKKTMILFLLMGILMCALLLNGDVRFLGPDSFIGKVGGYPFYITSGCIYTNSSSTSGTNYVFSAPIQLPEGAKITSLVVFFMDKQSSSKFTVHMFRKNRYNGALDTIIPEWSSTDSGDTYRIYKLTNVDYKYNKILNNSCTYHIQVKFVGIFGPLFNYTDIKVYGVKVFYAPPTV